MMLSILWNLIIYSIYTHLHFLNLVFIGKSCYKKDCKGLCHLWSIQYPVLGARQQCAGKSCCECGRAYAVLRFVGPASLLWALWQWQPGQKTCLVRGCGLACATPHHTALPACVAESILLCLHTEGEESLLALSVSFVSLWAAVLPKIIHLE